MTSSAGRAHNVDFNDDVGVCTVGGYCMAKESATYASNDVTRRSRDGDARVPLCTARVER